VSIHKKITNDIVGGMSNSTIMQASHLANLDLSNTPLNFLDEALEATIYPNLSKITLILLGQFCDAGFDVLLTKENVILI